QLFSDWIVTMAYVGSGGNHLFIQNELDPAIYGKAGATVNARRRLAPNYTSIVDMLSVGNSSYNALQITANKRFHHGFTVLMNYTWSKSIDEGSADGSQASNPFNIRADRGLSEFDIPQRFVTSFVWQLPGVTNHGALARWVAGGWEMNGILTLQSGGPFSVVSGVDNSQSAINLDRANLTGDAQLSGGRSKARTLREYFNTAAFTVNPPGTFGNAGRDILRGPGVANLDFGAIKNFQVRERYKAQFRAESFNLFNHANFGNPNANVSSPNFGIITSTSGAAAGSPRVIQLALKFIL
ncbi:MAG: carboxypeptidase regulatory-like domain-containing protein, partial [Bryobacteraceae bacterium]